MQWNDFQFCCRFLHQKVSEGYSLDTSYNALIKSYPRFQPSRLKNNFIYQSLSTSPDKHALLSIYGSLNINWDKTLITKLSNIKNYLFTIFIIFLVTSTITNTYVLPVFVEIFEQFDQPIANQIKHFHTFWTGSIVLLILSCVLLILFSKKVQQIQKNNNPNNFSVFSNFLLSNEIVNQIKKTDALLYSPLNKNINEFSATENALFSQLESDNLNAGQELTLLINNEYIKLSNLINKRLKKFLSFVGAIVSIAIFNFVYNLYTPIFSIGTII